MDEDKKDTPGPDAASLQAIVARTKRRSSDDVVRDLTYARLQGDVLSETLLAIELFGRWTFAGVGEIVEKNKPEGVTPGGSLFPIVNSTVAFLQLYPRPTTEDLERHITSTYGVLCELAKLRAPNSNI